MAHAVTSWWQANRWLVLGTFAVAALAGLVFGAWRGPGAGALVAGSVLAFMVVLMLSSSAMGGGRDT